MIDHFTIECFYINQTCKMNLMYANRCFNYDRSPGLVDLSHKDIIECLKKTGMSLKDIREYIELAMQGDETIARRLELFRKQRTVLETRMAELQQTMDTLDYKCWFYETAAARGSTEGISDLPDEALPEALRPVRERLRAAAEAETEEV